jgi:Cu2+-exporting ATPase
VEQILSKLDGVEDAVVNFAASTVKVKFNPRLVQPSLFQEALGKQSYLLDIDGEKDLKNLATLGILKTKCMLAIALSIPVMVLGMTAMHNQYVPFILALLSVPIVFYFGWDFHQSAWSQLKSRHLGMDALVSLSTLIAFIYSLFNTFFPTYWTSKGLENHLYYEAATMIITFVLLGKFLEEKAKNRTTSALQKLIGLQSTSATLVDFNDMQLNVDIDKIMKYDTLLVRPGERIAVDGKIIEGSTYIDEHMLSGESLPIFKQVGDKVFAGTINQSGSIKFQANEVGSQTVLAHIIKHVEEAIGSKAPIQKLADRVASIFIPIVLLISVSTFILWNIFGGVDGFYIGLSCMIAVLVIACPCALGLATPTAISVGMGRAAEKGILYRNAECMEQLQNIDSIVIDKTGTLTTGTPQVVEIFQVLDNAIAMSIFKSIEQKSEHPLAKSIVSYLHEIPTVKIQNYQTYAGKGISGTFSEGKYFIGSIAFIKDNGILLSQSIEEKLTIWEQKAYSVIILSDDKQILAIAALQDSIRENVSSVIKYLEDKRINLSILSGDSDAAVASIAAQVGISVYHSRMLPQDKATFIAGLQQKGHKVLMVGDGINDSPALAQADVSIAMGSGTDIAMEVADITLLHGDLQKIPVAIELSENIYKVINQNLIWAFLYNIISIPIAAGILYPTFGYLLHPMLAAAAMSVSSVSVVTNSLRLRKM